MGYHSRVAAGYRLVGAAARDGTAVVGLGRPERPTSARKSAHRILRDRGAGRRSVVLDGQRPGPEYGAPQLRLHRHLAQPGSGYSGLPRLVRSGTAAEERVSQV